MASTREVRLRRYPEGRVAPSDFTVVEVELPPLRTGQVLVRNGWTSVDPGMRLRIRSDAPAGYFPAFPLDSALDGILTVGTVEGSRSSAFSEGDLVVHAQGWREHSVVDAAEIQLGGLGTLAVLEPVRQPEWYLGPLGGMGLTAYAGLLLSNAIDNPGVLWVSAAAGAVGSLAAQIGRLVGNEVVASAGTPEKVAWLRARCGVVAFSHRDGDLDDSLSQAAPRGIDIYFDNVGGAHLEAALRHLTRRGRITLCGSVSDYEGSPSGPANLFLATSKELVLHGLRGSGHLDRMSEMREHVGQWLASGNLIYEQSVFDGLERAPEALVELLAGRTLGKTLVKLDGSPS